MRNGCCDCFEYASPIRHDLVIVEPQHVIALRYKKGAPPCVVLHLFRLKMLPAVDLDDKTRLVTDEINAEWSDRSLSSKARAAKPVRADAVPDDTLGISHVAPQRARAGALSR